MRVDVPEPREFRAVPGQVHAVHGNVTLGNMGFEEFAAAASRAPDQVLRAF
ncbi:DUF6924 domain-containing protein [Streptomyces roseofulvus]|uniref:DUF6924 domain-containing protein n=1 Tax=Streptomyces roseofulvus TaxID=33902 RepID=UPI0031FA3A10